MQQQNSKGYNNLLGKVGVVQIFIKICPTFTVVPSSDLERISLPFPPSYQSIKPRDLYIFELCSTGAEDSNLTMHIFIPGVIEILAFIFLYKKKDTVAWHSFLEFFYIDPLWIFKYVCF